MTSVINPSAQGAFKLLLTISGVCSDQNMPGAEYLIRQSQRLFIFLRKSILEYLC